MKSLFKLLYFPAVSFVFFFLPFFQKGHFDVKSLLIVLVYLMVMAIKHLWIRKNLSFHSFFLDVAFLFSSLLLYNENFFFRSTGVLAVFLLVYLLLPHYGKLITFPVTTFLILIVILFYRVTDIQPPILAFDVYFLLSLFPLFFFYRQRFWMFAFRYLILFVLFFFPGQGLLTYKELTELLAIFGYIYFYPVQEMQFEKNVLFIYFLLFLIEILVLAFLAVFFPLRIFVAVLLIFLFFQAVFFFLKNRLNEKER